METDTETDQVEERRNLIANERAKLTATFLNGVAIAMVAVGGLAPLTSTLIVGETFSPRAAIAISVTFVIAYVVHLLARRLLGSLQP